MTFIRSTRSTDFNLETFCKALDLGPLIIKLLYEEFHLIVLKGPQFGVFKKQFYLKPLN